MRRNNHSKKFSPEEKEKAGEGNLKSNLPGSNPSFPVLHYKSGSATALTKFKEQVDVYLTKTYGLNGDFVAYDKYHEYEPVPERGRGENEQAHLLKLKSYQKKMDDLDQDKPKMYGDLIGNLSPESLQKVMSTEGWKEIERSRDPLRLWLKIKETHLAADDSIPIVAIIEAKQRYYQLNQGANESIVQFLKRHEDSIQAISALIEGYVEQVKARAPPVGVPPAVGVVEIPDPEIPTDAEQAALFIKSLDKSRYSGYRANLLNLVKSGVRAHYPKTLMEAFSDANDYVVTTTHNQVVPAASAFATKFRKTVEKATTESAKGVKDKKVKDKQNRGCHICKSVEHFMKDCPKLNDYNNLMKGLEAPLPSSRR